MMHGVFAAYRIIGADSTPHRSNPRIQDLRKIGFGFGLLSRPPRNSGMESRKANAKHQEGHDTEDLESAMAPVLGGFLLAGMGAEIGHEFRHGARHDFLGTNRSRNGAENKARFGHKVKQRYGA